MPVSATWLLAGLPAGRETAISIIVVDPPSELWAEITGIDLSKAGNMTFL